MTEEEYLKWKQENDNRVGRCPFCGKPGWIVGCNMDGWCEHYVGTSSIGAGFEPSDLFWSGIKIERLERVLEVVGGLKEAQKCAILERLSEGVAGLVRELQECGILFLVEEFFQLVELQACVTEALFEDEYRSFFLKNPQEANSLIAGKVNECLDELEGVLLEQGVALEAKQ